MYLVCFAVPISNLEVIRYKAASIPTFLHPSRLIIPLAVVAAFYTKSWIGVLSAPLQTHSPCTLSSSQIISACNARIDPWLTLKSCRNSTTFSYAASSTPDTYWGQFDEISKYHVHLNYFERLWAAWYAFMGNDVLATGIMSFAMHELVYFGRSLPWIIIDCIPALNKYKIQNVSLSVTFGHRERRLTIWTAKNPDRTRTVELCEACSYKSFHR